jgi:membrane protein DedA with SNARE-associated domain
LLSFTSTASAVVFLAGIVEGLGIPWPGAFILAGTAATSGDDFSVVPVSAFLFTAGYCLGSYLQFLVGWTIGPRVLAWLPDAHRLKLERLTAKYGMGAVLWLRPLAIGNYVSLPAGLMRMSPGRFALYTGMGIGPWAVAVALAGWFLNDQIDILNPLISRWSGPTVIILGIAFPVVGAIKLIIQRRRRARELAASETGG